MEALQDQLNHLTLEGEYYKAFLVPTQSLSAKYGLDEIRKEDPRYNQQEDYYEFKIKKDWVLLLDTNPAFQRYFVFQIGVVMNIQTHLIKQFMICKQK